MDKSFVKRLGVPLFFLLLFLIPAAIWDTLIYPNSNVFFVLSGHMTGEVILQ